MKKFLLPVLIAAILCAGQFCKKSNASGNTGTGTNNTKPVPTSVGTPAGTKTSKLIPQTGGSITSADGKLEIDIPNGALSADDTITIQPITNNCLGTMALAYRLGPDGTKFNQPVTLKFHYDDSVLNETSPNYMLLAYQDTTGIWFVLNNAKNDTVNHIISGTTTHFTDFTWFADVILNPSAANLKPGETLHLNIQITVEQEHLDKYGNQGYALLKGSSSTWEVNGVTNGNDQFGKITIVPNAGTQLYDYVTYTAPSQIPPKGKNPVLVSAEFDQPFLEESTDTTVAINKVILYAHIYIYDIDYHVKINFEADSVSESGAYWNWKDQGSFDVVFAGTTGFITNINNSDAVVAFESNISTCTVSVNSPGSGPIQIQDSGIVTVNPFAGNITVAFNRSLNPAYYIPFVSWNYSCPGGDTGLLGGGTGPSFPTYVQFNIDSTNIQTMVSGQYTIVVSPLK